MPSPKPRKRSTKLQFRRRTPEDIWLLRNKLATLGIKVSREVTKSLGTGDQDDAKALHTSLADEWNNRWKSWRKAVKDGPQALTPKEIAGLSAEIGRGLLSGFSEPTDEVISTHRGQQVITWTDSEELFSLIGIHGPERYPAVNQRIEALLQRILRNHKIFVIDKESHAKLKSRIVADLPKLARQLGEMQDGNYSEPSWLQGRPKASEVLASGTTFKQLIDGWVREQRPKQESIRVYKDRCESFARWLGHNNASRVTQADVQGWKDSLLASKERKSLKDVKLKLDALRSMLKFGIANGRLPYRDNPAQLVRVSLKKERRKKRSFNSDEANMILSAARQQKGFARWGIWLMAYSGARPGEVSQLRLQDLQCGKDGHWTVVVTAEAGTLKTVASERVFPLHSAMIAEGFAKYVEAVQNHERLFPELFSFAEARGLSLEDAVRDASRKGRDRVRRMLDNIEGFEKEATLSLMHSWRHRFKTLCRNHGVSEPASKAIMGHEDDSVADRYGEGPSLPTLRHEIEKIPATVVSGAPAADDGVAELPAKKLLMQRAKQAPKKRKLKPKSV
jgi:integrase